MFLVARGADNRSFFEYNHESWSKWPRWSDSETSWDEVRDVYTKDYGDPVGTYREIRHAVFERSYTRVNITVDCNTQNATYTWIK